MTRSLILAASLAIAACGQQQPAPANQAAGEPAEQVEETPVPSLEGSWTIAAVDGRPVSQASAMSATFEGGKAAVASGCQRRAWTYSQKRNILSFAADPGGSMNCGAGPSGEQDMAYAALEQASMVIFDKDGSRASLSGGGGNLTLQRR